MCGIIGYIGILNAISILLNGLKKLEYRGYDSSGIAVVKQDSINIIKSKGRLAELESKIEQDYHANLGIGHTRWATHGEPSYANAHPHMSQNENFAVVHNGIIENHIELRELLLKKNYTFNSETDSEVITHLMEYYYDGSILGAIQKVLEQITGTYALGIISKFDPDRLFAVRNDNPLVIGKGEKGNYISSDVNAIINYTKNIYYPADKNIAILSEENIEFCKNNKKTKEELFKIDWNFDSVEKNGFKHYMAKEIAEQPDAIRRNLEERIKNGKVILDNFNLPMPFLEKINKIHIIGCGTAYYAAILGKYFIEKVNKITTNAESASEFRYRDPVIDENTLCIFLSQSGETLDTITALRYAREKGAKTVSIVNTVKSTLSRESDETIYMRTGPEIAVASTKAYSTMLTSIYLLSLHIKTKLNPDDNFTKPIIESILKLPSDIENLLRQKDKIKKIASIYQNEKNIFFIGRGFDYATCLEGSLKLKEISYISSEAYAAGELKHGTIALIDKNSLAVIVATNPTLTPKTINNALEIKARGGIIFSIANENAAGMESVSNNIFYIPRTNSLVAGSLSIIPLQLFAYYISLAKGLDIDKPRNLAKSVTVE